MPQISVVIPTYNEAENIQSLLRDLLALPLDLRVIVVDDNSPDGTGDLAMGVGSSRVELITRTDERGYGSAALCGFRRALELESDLVVSMDADFSHTPATIPDLVEGCRSHDVAIGSRYCPDGGTINWPLYRMALSRTANRYVRTILCLPVTDATSGFRCYRRDVLARLDLEEIRSDGYSFLVELLYRVWLAGASITERPILFMDRLKGKSKISSREIYKSIFIVLWLRLIRHRF